MAWRRNFKTDHVTQLTDGWRSCRVKRDTGRERRFEFPSKRFLWKLKGAFIEYLMLMSAQSLGRFCANDLEFPGEKIVVSKENV